MSPNEFINQVQLATNHSLLQDVCRKFVLHGTPYVFSGRENEFYEFRKRIANKFNISFHEVYITGSAKLGISPLKGTEFSYDSDVDVALVSSILFDEVMETIRDYQMSLRAYRRSITEAELRTYHQFLEYVAIGWIRPDKLPVSFQVKDLKDSWFKFFESISNGQSEVGNYKVSAGIFKTYRHLEMYTVEGLMSFRKKIEVEKSYDKAN